MWQERACSPSTLHQHLKMIAEPNCHSDDGQRWIDVADGWKHRRTCNVNIVEAVDAAVSVNDAPPRVLVHARCAHEMRTAVRAGQHAFFIFRQFNTHSAEAR